MHDSEQEHSGITGCRVTYESTIFYNEANKFSIIVVKTNDPRIPLQACNGRYYGDRMLRFTAVGYELPRTKAVELELDGEWVENKYGYQLQVEQWQEIVPQTADGLLAYLGSGLIKGIGPKTAEDIVATFGPDTLNILDNEPEKLLQIRGITEGKLKDIEESYAESRVLRNLMSLLGPFKITPATALKIYQNFGPACVDILKKCPYDLCQISGFGFKRVDGIVRKTDNRLHSAERIKGAVLYTLEDARSKSGHLFLPAEDLTKETLLMCRRQAYDMKDKSVLFPKNCAAAHDREAERIQKINDAQKKKAFCMAYAGFARKAALSNKELQIVCPKQANDLVDEGKALHHCVGGYIDSVAEGRSLIVFVRRVEEPKKPYVTVEVRDGKIAQIHGDHNSAPTEEVQKFVDLWSRKVLPIALQVA